jgi:hypothetical protein
MIFAIHGVQATTQTAFALLNTGRCFDPYQSWSNSSTYKSTADWNMRFMPNALPYHHPGPYGGKTPVIGTTSRLFEQFIDLNGDGLVDYIYSYRSQNQVPASRDCVNLNTGTGWENVYRCAKSGATYYGDCAG